MLRKIIDQRIHMSDIHGTCLRCSGHRELGPRESVAPQLIEMVCVFHSKIDTRWIAPCNQASKENIFLACRRGICDSAPGDGTPYTRTVLEQKAWTQAAGLQFFGALLDQSLIFWGSDKSGTHSSIHQLLLKRRTFLLINSHSPSRCLPSGCSAKRSLYHVDMYLEMQETWHCQLRFTDWTVSGPKFGIPST